MVQIVRLSKSKLSPFEDLQCAVENVAINIKVTIVRQTIILNLLFTLSTMINIFHDICSLFRRGSRWVTQ